MNPLVLVCESPLIDRYLAMLVRRVGREAVCAPPRDAVEMVQAGGRRVELLITNTPREFVDVAGDVPFLYVSSAPDEEVAARFPRMRVLLKPFRPVELMEAVEALTAS